MQKKCRKNAAVVSVNAISSFFYFLAIVIFSVKESTRGIRTIGLLGFDPFLSDSVANPATYPR
jgi:hypothetical protein